MQVLGCHCWGAGAGDHVAQEGEEAGLSDDPEYMAKVEAHMVEQQQQALRVKLIDRQMQEKLLLQRRLEALQASAAAAAAVSPSGGGNALGEGMGLKQQYERVLRALQEERDNLQKERLALVQVGMGGGPTLLAYALLQWLSWEIMLGLGTAGGLWRATGAHQGWLQHPRGLPWMRCGGRRREEKLKPPCSTRRMSPQATHQGVVPHGPPWCAP
jgi:hypothetical protein